MTGSTTPQGSPWPLLAKLDALAKDKDKEKGQEETPCAAAPSPQRLIALVAGVGHFAHGLMPLVDELTEKVQDVEERGGIFALSAEDGAELLEELEEMFDDLEERLFALGLLQEGGEDGA